MTEQLQLDLKVGKKLRDEGMTLASMTNKELLQAARAVARELCYQQGFCTSDDVRRAMRLPAKTERDRQQWIGSIFKHPDFEFTGRVRMSAIKSNHARLIRVWQLRRRAT